MNLSAFLALIDGGNLSAALVTAAAIIGLLLLKRMSFVSTATAQRLLSQGARIIDVRSPGEFQAGHVPGAINIPLGDLRDRVPREMKDKSQALLVHCLSGGRSGIAKHQLKSMGYKNVFNLGSLSRARGIISA